MKSPKAPDPKETANAQAGMNRDTALTQQGVNMVDQFTPDGSLIYTQDGMTGFTDSSGKWVEQPRYKATTTLSESQQAIKDQTDKASLNLGTIAADRSDFLKGYLSEEMDVSGIPKLRTSIGNGFSGDIGGGYDSQFSGDIGGGYSTDIRRDIGGSYRDTLDEGYATSYAGADDFSADRQRVQDALIARMQPGMDQKRQSLETQLVGRGLRPGTAAWNSEMERLGRTENDASLAAILGAGEEQARMVGMSRDAAAFGNSAITNRFQLENGASLTAADFDRTGQLAGNDAALTAAGYRTGAQSATNAAAAAAAGMRNDAALTDANFGNAARGQGLSEAFAKRSQPINEIAALLAGSQVQQPNFVNTPSATVGGVDYTGLVSDKFKADTAAYQAKMGGLFGLAAAPFSMFKFGGA